MVGRAVVGHAVGRAVGVRRGGASWWGVVVGRAVGRAVGVHRGGA